VKETATPATAEDGSLVSSTSTAKKLAQNVSLPDERNQKEEKRSGSKGGATQGHEALNVEARKLEMIDILEKDPNAELIDPETGQPISKRKRKRLIRWGEQRKLRPEKRKAYRERKRKRREEERKNLLENDKKMLAQGKISEKELIEIRKKRKKADQIRSRSREEMAKLIEASPNVAIDLGLDSYMTLRESRSLATQVKHAYGYMMRSERPLRLWLTGVDEEKGLTPQALMKDPGYNRWLMPKTPKDYVEVFGRENVVYLSSDAEETLNTLDPKTTYIIGGIVDHNRHKGLCQRLATEKNVRTARLPISQYMEGSTRDVITVNQVYMILLKYRELGDWAKAFVASMPTRKGYKVRAEGATKK